jgi:hypothetical protein
MKLGEPDQISADGQRLGYESTRINMVWSMESVGGGAVGDVYQARTLQLSFDQNNRLLSTELTKRWGGDSSFVKQLDSLDGFLQYSRSFSLFGFL